jgi:hypothetical protein
VFSRIHIDPYLYHQSTRLAGQAFYADFNLVPLPLATLAGFH